MARPLRFAPPGWPLHVWCRGNRQQDIFFHDADRRFYLDLLVQHAAESAVSIIAYCLMRNHVHLVLEPTTDDGLSWAMMRLNSEYAQKMQFRMQVNGHFWQGRFKASLLDESYFWIVMRYVELNPVRAGIIMSADQWPWSSAAAHLGMAEWPKWLARERFCSRHTDEEWRTVLTTAVAPTMRAHIWKAIRQNRPLASDVLVRQWEAESGLQLVPGKMGRPSKKEAEQLADSGRFSHGV